MGVSICPTHLAMVTTRKMATSMTAVTMIPTIIQKVAAASQGTILILKSLSSITYLVDRTLGREPEI